MFSFLLLLFVQARIYGWDIERAEQLTCTGYKEPIPECLENPFSRYHIKQNRNLTIKFFTDIVNDAVPEIFLTNDTLNYKFDPVVIITRLPFEVHVRVPELEPSKYELKVAGFPVGIRVILDSANTQWPMKSGTLPNSDSRNNIYLLMIPAGLLIIGGIAFGSYKLGQRKGGEQRVELLDNTYDDEFEIPSRQS